MKRFTFSERVMIIIIGLVIAMGILGMRYGVECMFMKVSDMPGYCFYLLGR